MKHTVSDLVLRETQKCPHDFACLEAEMSGNKPMCEVKYANGKNVLFLNAKESVSCPYRLPFGYGQVCQCPTHFAIVTTCK